MWGKLTPSEQKEFEDVVKSGKIGHLITVYKPWWEVSVGRGRKRGEGEKRREEKREREDIISLL